MRPAPPRRPAHARRRLAAALAGSASAAILALGGAPAAGAAVLAGAADDPVDAALPGGRDVVHVEARYDDVAGELSARVTFREAPTSLDVFAGAFGTRPAAGACDFPATLVAGATGGSAPAATWRRYEAGGALVASGEDAARALDGATVTYVVRGAAFAGRGYDCLGSAQVAVPGVATPADTIADLPLAPVVETPPQGQPPAPDQGAGGDGSGTPPAPAAPPAPAGGGDRGPGSGRTGGGGAGRPAARAAPRRARLVADVQGGARRTLRRNRWTTLRIRVANAGTAPARRATLTVAASRGATVRVAGTSPRRPAAAALPALGPGRAATVRVRVRASRASTLSVVVRAGRLLARQRVTLALAAPRRRPGARPRRPAARIPRPGAGGTGPDANDPLAGRLFWGTDINPMYAWSNHAVWFLGGGWAYLGFPPSGRPRCGAPTTVVDEDGTATGDGCRRVSFDAASGALTVGELSGSFRDGSVKLGEDAFPWEVTIPRPGARYDVELEHRGFSGMCGLIMGCTTWHYLLVLRADGRFLRANSATTTLGDGTVTPFVWGSSMPPDATGTYEILADGAIRFSYLDGSVATETIAVERDAAGREDPSGEGILLGDTNYYPSDD